LPDSVNDIAKWLDEFVPNHPADTDTVGSEEVNSAQAPEDMPAAEDVRDSHQTVDSTEVFDDSQMQGRLPKATEGKPLESQVEDEQLQYDRTVVFEDLRDSIKANAENPNTPEPDPAPPSEGTITQYNSAVNYITDLIEQLRIPESTDAGTPAPSLGSDATRTDQTCVLGNEDFDSLGIGRTMPLDPDLAARIKNEALGEDPELLDDPNESEQGYAYRRSLLHSLREAAHLATNTSLELNDCAKHAHRAYYAGCFGCASAFFSIVFVLMSPKAGTFGFAASVGAFSLAFCLVVVYVMSYRAFLTKAWRVRSTGSSSPVPDPRNS
jgi:hypothetical protein